jgi:transcriptional regulator with XRE-family HTH domain
MNDNSLSREDLCLLQQERLLVHVALAIHRRMKAVGVSRKQLASLLGVSKGRISQILGGERNLTLRTLADIFTALEARVQISEIGSGFPASWEPLDVPGVIRLSDTHYTTMPLTGPGNDDYMSLAS